MSQLDQSYTGDFGASSIHKMGTTKVVPANLPGPPNLGGEIGQLEQGFPLGLDQSTQLDTYFTGVAGSVSTGTPPAVEGTNESFDSYIGNPLGAKIM